MKNWIQTPRFSLFGYFTHLKRDQIPALILLLAGLLGGSANAQLLHRYDFTSTNDTVGTANGTLTGGATLSGGTLVTAGGNGAVSGLWGNTNSPMMILNTNAVSGLTNAFTIESWFSCSTGWPKFDSLFAFSDGTTANYLMGNPVMGYSPWPSGCNIAGGGGSSGGSVRGIYLDSGTLHQVVLTYDGSTFTWYVDGAVANFSGYSATLTDPGFKLSTLTDVGINGGSPWGDPCLTGSTYDFRIYGQALSALQITEVFALGSDAANSDITGVVSPAPATAFTWNGLGSDNNWGTGLNWLGGSAPATNGTILTFAGSARTSPNLETSYNVNSLIFSNNASSFSIGSTGGNVLKLTGIPVEVDSANPQTLNLTVADNGVGLTKSGSGTLNLPGANTYTGQTIVNNGTLNVSGSLASTANISIGNGATNSVLDVSGTITPNMLLVGNVSNAVGAVYQTGGSVTATANTGADNLSVGNLPGAYGYYDANGGTATINGICVAGENGIGASGGNGILDISGGAAVNCTGWFVVARNGNAQTGVVNLYNGSLTYAGGGMICNWGSGQTTMINVMGGTLATATTANNEIGFLAGTGIVNLLGGLTSVSAINGAWSSPNGQVNFNGGTLQAIVNTTAFIAVTSATVFHGGGTIDANGWPISIAQPLLASTGNGVSTVTAFSGGAGYIAPPIVTIAPGAGDTTGVGATAIAQINPTTGTVTGIIITCPGVNYTATPKFTFTGGGAATQAAVTGVALAANHDGGLVFEDSYGLQTPITLTGVNTYTGNTTIAANSDLALTGLGSLSSTNIIVDATGIFDVSGITYSLGVNQALAGYGNVNGAVTTSAGSKIYGGTDGTYGTLTFNNSLTLVPGATCNLDLGITYNGNNDQLIVSGALTANNNSIHIKAPSTSSSLDATTDYVLITAASITGSFASAPVWDVAPANAGHYSIVTTGTTVSLHYSASASPTLTALANPTTLLRNQATLMSATVTPGVNPVSTVSVDMSAVGGSAISLVRSNTSNLYTNTVTIPAAASPGSAILTVVATDSTSLSGSTTVSLIINASAEVWNGGGANQNWSTSPNWLSGFAPGLIGDSITFAGNTALTPNVDQNFSATGLIFSNNASSFTVGTANSSTLTLTANGIVNNSANAQTITAPLNISSTEPVNATAGNIAISSTISGTGGIAKTGNSQLTLTGSGSSLGGSLSVNAGILSVPGGSSAFGGQPSRVGYLTGSGTLNMTGGSLSNSGELQVGGSDQSGTGINAAGAINLTSATLSVGALTVARGNNPQNTVSGLVTLNSGSTLNCEGDCLVDFAGAVSGKIVVNGGTLNHATTTKRWFIMSEWDFGSSEVDVNSGQVNINANTDIRFATQGNTGTNVFNLNGGAVTFFSDNGTTVGGSGVLDLHQGNGSTVNNSFNLNGGTLTVSAITSANASGTRAFNFNGGTLKAPAANATFMALGTGSAAANVRNGGAIINDGGFAVTIIQPLLHSAIAGDNATDGGLTKLGTGTLTLSGANTYNGTTIVSAGALEMVQAVLATSAAVSIATGAVLQLDFATTNQVNALVLNGVSQAPGVYNSTTTPTYISGTGSLLVQAGPSGPANLVSSLSGNALHLTWPAGQGWRLVGQTNSLSTGLNPSSAAWGTVSGVTDGSASITIDSTKPTVFYRLVYP